MTGRTANTAAVDKSHLDKYRSHRETGTVMMMMDDSQTKYSRNFHLCGTTVQFQHPRADASVKNIIVIVIQPTFF